MRYEFDEPVSFLHPDGRGLTASKSILAKIWEPIFFGKLNNSFSADFEKVIRYGFICLILPETFSSPH